MTATSTEHNTDNSCAFLNKPPFRLRNVLIANKAVRLVRIVVEEISLHRTIAVIFNGLDFNLPPTHRDGRLRSMEV